MATLIGRQLGQYQIVKLLGEGGMATVYRARQISVERDVAIKVIRQSFADDTTFLKRFNREARTVASLSHPHIVKLFDYGQQDEIVYLVMELMTGGSLFEFMQGRLSLETSTQFLEQIASALDYAHRRGIIHRDLKPQNVLLDDDKNAFLTDFGISKLLGSSTALATSSSDLFAGTPAYASPEQWSGGTIDARADLYSLAIMLYEMVCGRRPFEGDTPFRMMHQHTYEAPPAPSSINSALSPQLDAVMIRALAKVPADRFESGAALLRAFKEATAQISQSAAPTRPARDPRKATSDETIGLTPVAQPTFSDKAARPSSENVDVAARENMPTTVEAAVTHQSPWRFRGAAYFGIALFAIAVVGAVLFASQSTANKAGSALLATGSSTPSTQQGTSPAPSAVVSTEAVLPASSHTPLPSFTPVPSLTSTTTPQPSATPTATLDIEATTVAAQNATVTQVFRFFLTAQVQPTSTMTSTATFTTTITLTPTDTATLSPSATNSPTATATSTYTNTATSLPTATDSPTAVPISVARIAFIARSGAYQGITLIGADGANRQELTRTTEHYFAPLSWSPVTQEFVFSARSNTTQTIWTADEEGRANVIAQGIYPSWSPNGRYIAFLVMQVVKGQQVYQIYLKTQDGEPYPITTTGVKSAFLAWSPDGKRIAVISGGILLEDVPSEDSNSLITPTPLHRLNNDDHLLAAAWSPNGDSLAVAPTTGQGFYLLKIATGEQQKLASNQTAPSTAPSWSSDSERLVYASAGHIYVINSDGSGQKLLGEGLEPAWSPDGSQIAYSLQGKIYVMDADGANAKYLADGASPIWVR